MARRQRYRYVDFAARAQPGFRNQVVPVDAVPGLVARYGAEECYTTIFHFADEVLLYVAEHRVAGRPSIAGYDGRVWAPFVPLDIDAHPEREALPAALEVARETYRLLIERWHAPPEAVHAYFSGAKGFHLLIDTRAFGRVAPSRDLHRVFSRLRLQILRALPEAARPLFDLAIGDKVRLLRLPNTRHGGSGRYKVALDPLELMRAPVAEILALARAPRPLRRVAVAGLLPVEPVAAAPALREMMERARRGIRAERGAHPYRLGPPPAAPEAALCAARLALWQSPVPSGRRNNAAIRLASAFRLAGYTEAQTRGLLRDWNRRHRIDLPERELDGVVASAYARPYPYTFGCHDEVIREVCPFVERWQECADYRELHPRSGRT